ncbi:MAG: murein biosynthesis integral membrane protein MurJ, partial [Anaerolineae bacterium]|nr:murein biosynthesis integral membrane protein MurJ [Anaerolineae bacterium]
MSHWITSGAVSSTTPSHTRRVARAAIIVMVFFVLSRALGFLREVVIARQFGTSAELDAYLAAFRIPDLLFALMAGGALGSALIPVLSDYLARDDERAAWQLASAVLNWVVLAMGGVAALVALGAPLLVRTVIAPGFTPAQHALTAELMRWMLLSTLIFGVSGIVMGILNARQHFLLPALAPAVYNVAITLGAWLLGPALGVRGAVVGVVAGAAAHLLVQLPALRHFNVRYWPRLAPHDPGVREVGRLMAPRALGLAAVELNHLVNVVLASGLTTGSLAALNYGRMLMLLPEGIIAQSVAIAAFPTFSALAARNEHAAMRGVFLTTLRSVLYLTLPATVGLILLREPLVVTLLQRGAFDARSSTATAWALLFYALGLASHATLELITRAFYAIHDTRTPVGVGVAAMIANALLSVAFIASFRQLGWAPHGGLALANTLATTAEMGLLLYLLHRRLQILCNARALTRALGRIGAGCL